MTGSHLSGGKKGLPQFTCSVYGYFFPSLSGDCVSFLQRDKTKTNLSKGRLNIRLGGGQEKPWSYLILSTGIINAKLAA